MWLRLLNIDDRDESGTYVNTDGIVAIVPHDSIRGCCWLYISDHCEKGPTKIFCGKSSDALFNVIPNNDKCRRIEWSSDDIMKGMDI